MRMEEHKCIHEKEIQDYGIQITELKTRSDYKEKSIMEIKDELKYIKDNIDAINNNVNKLILKSNKEDNKLEVELTQLKTHIDNLQTELDNKEKESDKRINRILVVVGLVFTAITIVLNILFQII